MGNANNSLVPFNQIAVRFIHREISSLNIECWLMKRNNNRLLLDFKIKTWALWNFIQFDFFVKIRETSLNSIKKNKNN